MRLIVYTGKGGVGKTSSAAATALACARRGLRTLIASTDSAHSLGDCFEREFGPEPSEVEAGLYAIEIDALYETRQRWTIFESWFRRYFHTETESIETDELVVFPGLEEMLALLRLREFCRSGEYDVVIADAAPTGETLSLLSLPELLSWYVRKTLPAERRMCSVARTLAKPLGVFLPDDEAFDGFEALIEDLEDMRGLLSDKETSSIRLVLNPEKMVIQEARRSYTYLSLYDFPVDAVIVNRVFPAEVSGSYLSKWSEIQSLHMKSIEESFVGLPILHCPFFEREVLGLPMLERMGMELFKDKEPSGVLHAGRGFSVEKTNGNAILRIPIPLAEKGSISLDQKGDELFIGVGHVRRNISLPRKLRSMKAVNAAMEGDSLAVRFESKEELSRE